MSLGLGDLKKKQKSAPKRVVKSVDVDAPSVAKPWTSEDLAARSRSKGRKREEVPDLALNDEIPNMQAAPLFFMELASDSRLAKVEDTLLKIEERVVRALDRPLKAAQLLFPKFFAQ